MEIVMRLSLSTGIVGNFMTSAARRVVLASPTEIACRWYDADDQMITNSSPSWFRRRRRLRVIFIRAKQSRGADTDMECGSTRFIR